MKQLLIIITTKIKAIFKCCEEELDEIHKIAEEALKQYLDGE